MKRCDICIEETCNGKFNCNCDRCENLRKCYRILHPTIRLTTKCTQKCSHCCFKCSPDGTRMMDMDTAAVLADFINNNEIISANIMGGEFFLNPNWYEILMLISANLINMRLVTTGDWIHDAEVCKKLIQLNEARKGALWVAVSKDQWHTNKNVEETEQFLEKNDFSYYIGTEAEDNEDAIVPIGRAEGTYGFLSMYGCYCQEPKNMYGFLINESGTIYKCGFGVWNYADIHSYREGGFTKRFKEFNKQFYKIFLPSCTACISSAEKRNRTDLQEESKQKEIKDNEK